MSDRGLGSWLARRVRDGPDRTALVYAGRTIGYRELDDRTRVLAARMHRAGVRAGERVAYIGANHPASVETMFATWRLGAVFVPLNARLSVSETTAQLADAEPSLLVHADELTEPATAAHERAGLAGRTTVGDWFAGGYPMLPKATGAVVEEHPADPGDLATLMYTSGTSGTPKGVLHTHGSLTWNCLVDLVDSDLGRDEVTLIAAPLFHAAALNVALLSTLLKGGTAVLMPAFRAEDALDLVERHRVTYLHGVPTIHESLVGSPRFASADLSSVRRASGGGSAASTDLVGAYAARGIGFFGRYGLTESGPCALIFPPHPDPDRRGGYPHFFMGVRLVDADGAEVPPGTEGEILLEGPNLMCGYWKRADPDADELARTGWLRTGDIGVRDAHGGIHVVGRLKDIYISGGENVVPGEVEAAIVTHPLVVAAGVVGVPDARWGEVGCAVVETTAALDLESLRTFLRDRLAGYKLPRHLVIVDELPRTATGKIAKDLLRELAVTAGGGP